MVDLRHLKSNFTGVCLSVSTDASHKVIIIGLLVCKRDEVFCEKMKQLPKRSVAYLKQADQYFRKDIAETSTISTNSGSEKPKN